MCLLSKLGRSNAFPQTSHGSKFLSPLWLRIFCCLPNKTSPDPKTELLEWKLCLDFQLSTSLKTSLPECLKLSASFKTWECVECRKFSTMSPALDEVSELVIGDFLSSVSPPKLGGELEVDPGDGIITLDNKAVDKSNGESEMEIRVKISVVS